MMGITLNHFIGLVFIGQKTGPVFFRKNSIAFAIIILYLKTLKNLFNDKSKYV